MNNEKMRPVGQSSDPQQEIQRIKMDIEVLETRRNFQGPLGVEDQERLNTLGKRLIQLENNEIGTYAWPK